MERLPPVAGGDEGVRERIERLVAEGRKSASDVQRAIEVWQKSLHTGVTLPNGAVARITLDDLYHLMVDDRILRKPDRIERVLRNIYELRRAMEGRQRALSTWQEDGRQLFGFAIIEPDYRIRTLHIIDRRDLRKYRNEAVVWTAYERPSLGTDQP